MSRLGATGERARAGRHGAHALAAAPAAAARRRAAPRPARPAHGQRAQLHLLRAHCPPLETLLGHAGSVRRALTLGVTAITQACAMGMAPARGPAVHTAQLPCVVTVTCPCCPARALPAGVLVMHLQ